MSISLPEPNKSEQPASESSRVISLRQFLDEAVFVGARDIEVRRCVNRADQCRPGDVFIPAHNALHDEADHAELAVQRGASAIVTERFCPSRCHNAWSKTREPSTLDSVSAGRRTFQADVNHWHRGLPRQDNDRPVRVSHAETPGRGGSLLHFARRQRLDRLRPFGHPPSGSHQIGQLVGPRRTCRGAGGSDRIDPRHAERPSCGRCRV